MSLTPEQSINLKFDISETTNVNEVTKFIYDRLNFDFNFSANIKLSAPEKDRPYRYQFISCKFSDASLKYKSNLFTYNYSGEKPTKTEITFDEAVTETITTSDGDYKKGFEPICSSYNIGKNYTDLPLCLKPYAQNLVQINFKTLNDKSNLSLNGFKLLNGKENKQDSVRSDLKFTVYGVLNSITYVDGNTVTFNDKPVNESEWLGLEKKIAILVPQKEEQVAWEGTGTIENPFLIKNSSDLLALKNSTKFMEGDYYFKQVEDISGLDNWGELKDRNFLYNYDLTFKGHYDGNGKTINGLNIKAEKKATLTIPEQENNYQALFRKCENAEISNLTINCNIDAVENSMVGALVGEAKASKFTNIVVNGSFKGADCIGGLVGSGTELVFKDIKVNANINGQNNAGGVLAFGDKVIAENISATSNIKGSDYVGGVFGCLKSNNSLTNITCSAEIEGASFCGGIVGSIGENSNGEKLQVSGKVSGMNAVGGIIGEAFGNRPNINKNATTIEDKPDTYSNLVSSAEVKASDENFRYGYGAAGGVICNAYDNISITNAINNGSVCGLQTVGGVIAHAKLNKIHTTDLHCITLSKCTNHGNITNINPKSTSSCGGVFGDVNNANINDCYNDGNLSGEKCGGILCRVFKSSINNCYSIGTLSSSSYRSEDLGALVVNMQKSSIANCFTTGDTKYINTSKNNKFHAIGIYDTDYKRYDNKDENIEVFGSAADIKLNETWKQDVWEIKSGEYPKLK